MLSVARFPRLPTFPPLHAARLLVLPILLILVLAVLAVWAPSFFRLGNGINILVQASSLGLMAMGMALVLIGGGIDLSIPANMAFCAVLGGLALEAGWPIPIGIALMVLCGAAVGLLNGISVAYLRMIPFVVTLATMTVLGGLAVWLTNSVSIAGFPEAWFDLFLARPGGIPVAILVLAVATLLISAIAAVTLFGRQLYAVGINPKAAQIARVPVGRVLLTSYVVAGGLAGSTAVLLSARLGSASANMGNDGVVLDIVSACVVGGISIYGGVGRPAGALFGAVFITLLSNAFNLLGVSSYVGLIMKGLVIIGFVGLDSLARAERR